LLLAWAGTAHPQLQAGNLYGQVVDKDGAPLPGVAVTLIGAGAPQVQVTNAQGQFRFLGLSPGTYDLKAELEGFATIEHPRIAVNVGRNTQIEIRLETGIEIFDEEENYAQVEVFYGTDRIERRSRVPEEKFGQERSNWSNLHLGVCRVSVPRDHRMGQIERPSIWRFEFRPDPKKHMVLLDVRPLSQPDFYLRLKGNLGKSRERELLVFIHGYNVSFANAVLRTAQLAYDLGLDGAPVLYSWPSQAVHSKYLVDETNVEWTAPHLEKFLRELAARSSARSIHLIAHSMGNRALTRALQQIAARTDRNAKPLFSEILLTAPDIDSGVFADLAKVFRRAGERVTLYASSNDEALKASKKVHGYPRAGESGLNLVVLPGVDTIDVSAVDTSLLGHSYYGDNRSVLSDVFNLLRKREPPDRRFGLRKRKKAGLPYWVFSP
jgi:esterase/lipase superfamily enzyme